MPLLRSTTLSLALLCATTCASGQSGPLFKASSKAQGAPFDLVVTETERHPTKSYLQVPGFHERSAAGARWLMCAYTALAVERGFGYWFVVYPPEGSTRLVVGLANSSSATAAQVLGPDFVKDRTIGDKPMPVERMAGLCGIKR